MRGKLDGGKNIKRGRVDRGRKREGGDDRKTERKRERKRKREKGR